MNSRDEPCVERAPAVRALVPINCLSIDVEGFVEASMEVMEVKPEDMSVERERYEIEHNVKFLLEFLGNLCVRATWFFLGRIAEDLPHLVRDVAAAGHEISCHGFHHRRIFNMSPGEFRESVARAKRALEDAGGTEVLGFRAPDFSITRSSLWGLDVLREVGFVYDSSVFPFGHHDVYGIGDADPEIHKLENGLVEFPPATTTIAGVRVPMAGGGYFRFYPVALTKALLRKRNREGRPAMFYIHPYEVGPAIQRISMPARARWRYYHNVGKPNRLKSMLTSFRFGTAIAVLRETAHL